MYAIVAFVLFSGLAHADPPSAEIRLTFTKEHPPASPKDCLDLELQLWGQGHPTPTFEMLTACLLKFPPERWTELDRFLADDRFTGVEFTDGLGQKHGSVLVGNAVRNGQSGAAFLLDQRRYQGDNIPEPLRTTVSYWAPYTWEEAKGLFSYDDARTALATGLDIEAYVIITEGFVIFPANHVQSCVVFQPRDKQTAAATLQATLRHLGLKRIAIPRSDTALRGYIGAVASEQVHGDLIVITLP